MNVQTIAVMYLGIVLSLAAFTGCGGGGGGGGDDGGGPTAREQVVVGMTLAGNDSTVGSVALELELPEDFIQGTERGILTTDLPDSYLEAVYQTEESVDNGLLQLAFISARGFSSQQFCILTKELAADETLPAREEFVVTSLTITDLDGVELSGYDLAVSVRRQEIGP